MAIYSHTITSAAATISTPAYDIKAGSTNSPKVYEIAVIIGAATASVFGFGRPGNDGSVTQTSPTLFLPENPADPTAITGAAVAWGTAPTVPPVFLRRVGTNNAVGCGFILTFPRGLVLPVNKGLVCWNIATNAASFSINAVIDE